MTMKELADERRCVPSLDELDDERFFLQTVPSMICARVLDVQPGQRVLDMCAAPGGKTTHLAQLVANKSRIVALEKIASKVERMRALCERLGAKCVECLCQDATKLDRHDNDDGGDDGRFQAASYDRILADVPCSSLGQRPLIYNDVSLAQLVSYQNYQRTILDNVNRNRVFYVSK